jgi:arsenate reductase
MAEGFAYQLKLNNKFKIYSAGVEAHGLNPRAVEAMDELGIDISHQKSEVVRDDELFQYDFIITLCGDAQDRCPILSSNNNNIHWDLEDPANAKGNDQEIMDIYRKIRDQILDNIKSIL